jgi:hypothetical protein
LVAARKAALAAGPHGLLSAPDDMAPNDNI